MSRLNRDNFTHLLELTLFQLFSRRNSVVVGAIRGGEICEVVANPGCDLVHETFRIGKGGCRIAESHDHGRLDERS